MNITINENLMKITMQQTTKQNDLEDKIALEWYGCKYDDLDYDEKELVTYEVIDNLL